VFFVCVSTVKCKRLFWAYGGIVFVYIDKNANIYCIYNGNVGNLYAGIEVLL